MANPFLSPDFFMLFGRHRPDAAVAVISDEQGIAGFLPFCRGGMGAGSALGVGITDAQGLIFRDEPIALLNVMRAAGLSVLNFDHLVAESVACSEVNSIAELNFAVSPFVNTDDDWEKWIASKRKESKRVTTALQKQRKLEREVGPLRFEPDSRDPAVLETLMSWKSAQYRRTTRMDRFALPWLRSLVNDCLEFRNADFESRLSVLYAGDQVVNIDLSLLANGKLAGWFPAYNFELSHYSPGFIAMLEMTKGAMSDARISELDMGKGPAPYKETLKSGEHRIAEGWLEANDWRSKLWRMRTEPQRRVMQFVLGNENLRLAARKTLSKIGEVRTKISG